MTKWTNWTKQPTPITPNTPSTIGSPAESRTSTHHAPRRGSQTALLAAACLAISAGSCATPPANIELPAKASRAATTADENDLDAAVEIAVGKHEMAVIRSLSFSRDPHMVRTYELRTATDEPAMLEVRRTSISSRTEPVELELRASVGAFGDAEREKAFLESVRRRLNQLAGVRVAPIR